MQIVKNKNSHLKLALIALVALISLGGVVYYAYSSTDSSKSSQSTEVDLEEPTDQQKESGSEIKEDAINDESSSVSAQRNSKSDQPQQEDSDRSTTSVKINSYRLDNNGNLIILTSLQTLESEGTCLLTLSKDGQTIEKQSGVRRLTSYSTCTGFTIPASEIASGTWKAQLNYKDNLSKGETSLDIEI